MSRFCFLAAVKMLRLLFPLLNRRVQTATFRACPSRTVNPSPFLEQVRGAKYVAPTLKLVKKVAVTLDPFSEGAPAARSSFLNIIFLTPCCPPPPSPPTPPPHPTLFPFLYFCVFRCLLCFRSSCFVLFPYLVPFFARMYFV